LVGVFADASCYRSFQQVFGIEQRGGSSGEGPERRAGERWEVKRGRVIGGVDQGTYMVKVGAREGFQPFVHLPCTAKRCMT